MTLVSSSFFLFLENYPNESLDLDTFKSLTKMEIILHSTLFHIYHDYPSTLFYPQLHEVEVQLGSVSRRGSLLRYEPSPGDIIGL